MIKRIRRWLNVKTWADTHVPIDITSHEYELRGQLLASGAPEHVVEEYIELDRMILAGEIDETSAMTGFYQGLDTFDSYWQCKKEKEEKRAEHNAVVWEKFVENQKKLYGELGDRERTRRSPDPVDYVFPAEFSPIEKVEGERVKKIVPVHVPPKSALMMPPKLTYAEKKMADLVTTSEPFLSEPLKLKPAFKKKLKASKGDAVRVTFDAKGKPKKVKS